MTQVGLFDGLADGTDGVTASEMALPTLPGIGAPAVTCQGCRQPLTARQLARGARCCSPTCRLRTHRQRRKAERLRDIDQAISALQSLRVEVERRW